MWTDRAFRRLPFARLLSLIAAAFMAPGLPESVSAADVQKQVLVLYSTRRDAQIAIVGDRELPRILEEGLPHGLDYYAEYLDRARFPDPEHQQAFAEFLRLKYREQRFDVVIAMQDLALEFIEANRDELFPDAPVVFFASSAKTTRIPNSTGVFAELNLKNTVDLAMSLQPDTQQVFVVGGAEVSDKAYEDIARAQFQSITDGPLVTYLSGLPRKQLESQLRSLPQHSIVYYLVFTKDGAGEKVHPLEYLEKVAAVANAPTYCWVDSAMDHGIVGGRLKSQKAETEAVAELALRVLRGERADSIPVSVRDLYVSQVDWRQMQRWGISERRVPAGTIVRFREPGLWERYKVYIVGALALVLAQSALIAGLLVQAARRRQAEERVRRSQEELRTSFERIRDLGGRLLNAQEDERARIARELHDDVSQQMAILSIDLQILESAGLNGDADAKQLANRALGRAQDVARSVHDLSHRLHPAKLRLIGIVAAIGSLQREHSRGQMTVTFSHHDVPAALPHELTLCLFRVVQEALQNAAKHSGARSVAISLTGGKDRLDLSISDDGRGFDVTRVWGRGLGLISMYERLEAIGGTLQIHATHGGGARLDATVPVTATPNSLPIARSAQPVGRDADSAYSVNR